MHWRGDWQRRWEGSLFHIPLSLFSPCEQAYSNGAMGSLFSSELSIYQFESCGRDLALWIFALAIFFFLFLRTVLEAYCSYLTLLNIRFDTRFLITEDI